MKNTRNKNRKTRNIKSRKTMRKKQRGSGLITAIGHRSKSVLNSVATYGKKAYGSTEVKFFNKFIYEPFIPISMIDNDYKTRVNPIQDVFNDTQYKSNRSLFKFMLQCNTDYYEIKLEKELNTNIFNDIKDLYSKVFEIDRDTIKAYCADNQSIPTFTKNYIFTTNRSGNNLYFRLFYKIKLSNISTSYFIDPERQRIFWINLFNLLKVYSSAEENESIPCLQLNYTKDVTNFDENTLYVKYVNNYKRSATRSTEGIIELSAKFIQDVNNKTISYYERELHNASAPPANASAPPANASAPPANASAPPANASAPPANASVPPANASVPPANASAPPANAENAAATAIPNANTDKHMSYQHVNPSAPPLDTRQASSLNLVNNQPKKTMYQKASEEFQKTKQEFKDATGIKKISAIGTVRGTGRAVGNAASKALNPMNWVGMY